jgi:hypothetical protein
MGPFHIRGDTMSVCLHPYIGADIEMFVSKKAIKHYRVVGATSIIRKDSKTIKKDGILLEINPTPETCRDEVKESIKRITKSLKTFEVKHKVKIVLDDIHTLNKSVFKKIAKEDKKLGCLPDINAYTNKINRIPTEYQDISIRSCGGHLHFGTTCIRTDQKGKSEKSRVHYPCIDLFGEGTIKTNRYIQKINSTESIIHKFEYNQLNIHKIPLNRWLNFTANDLIALGIHYDIRSNPAKNWTTDSIKETCKVKYKSDEWGILLALRKPLQTIKFIDLFTAIPSVLLDPGESGKARRELYGKAGAFRYTPYGLEYRTLSNYWMADIALFSLVTGLSRFAINLSGAVLMRDKASNIMLLKAGRQVFRWLNKETNLSKLQQAINENNFILAKEIYDEIIVPVMSDYYWDDEKHIPLTTKPQRNTFEDICKNKNGYKDTFKKETFINNWLSNSNNGWWSYSEQHWFKNMDKPWDKFCK